MMMVNVDEIVVKKYLRRDFYCMIRKVFYVFFDVLKYFLLNNQCWKMNLCIFGWIKNRENIVY